MNTYAIAAGGQSWEIGMPFTAEQVTLKLGNQKWPLDVVRAVSDKGTFLVHHFEHRMWRAESRPFDKDTWIAIGSDGHPIIKAPHLNALLWALGSGRDPRELDISTTASGGFDDQPAPRASRQQATPQQREQSNIERESLRPRESARQRLGRLLRLFKDTEGT